MRKKMNDANDDDAMSDTDLNQEADDDHNQFMNNLDNTIRNLQHENLNALPEDMEDGEPLKRGQASGASEEDGRDKKKKSWV